MDSTKSPWSPENNPSSSGDSSSTTTTTTSSCDGNNPQRKPKRGINKSRFRQHVNPLSRKFQMKTEIHDLWPNDGTYTTPNLPLHLDIGCGKGGFLLNVAKKKKKDAEEEKGEEEDRNYLGLEIRPSVALYAQERVSKWDLDGKLSFLGCNVNVDLQRILHMYTSYDRDREDRDSDGGSKGGGDLALVTIQFPDPHFKKSHQKRRVVTPDLVRTLAQYMKKDCEVFIQSDIQEVLDDMRETFRIAGSNYFIDVVEDVNKYLDVNPIGVPTEREISVLENNLPVYRTIFRRNSNNVVMMEEG